MLETAPFAATLTTSLADADTLRYYPAYESAPLAQLGEQTPVAAAHHLQLLLVQRPDGGLTIGDTHAYGEPFDFALCEDPTDELLDRARRILGAELPPVRRRWEGVYAQCVDGDVCLREEIEPGVWLVTGPGRARHDVLAGHRRRHAAGGGSGRVSGTRDRPLRAGLPRHGGHDRARRRRRRGGVHDARWPPSGVTPGSSVLRGGPGRRARDDGLVQGRRVRQAARARRGEGGHGRLRRRLRGDRRGRRRRRDPRRPRGPARPARRGGQGLPHDGLRTLDPGRAARRPGLAGRGRPGPLAGRRRAGAAPRPTSSSAPWPASASTTRARWRWWATR